MSLYGLITYKIKNSGRHILLIKPSDKAEIKKISNFSSH